MIYALEFRPVESDTQPYETTPLPGREVLPDTKELPPAELDTEALNALAHASQIVHDAAPQLRIPKEWVVRLEPGFKSKEELKKFCTEENEERRQRWLQTPDLSPAERLQAARVSLSQALTSERESGWTDETASFFRTAGHHYLRLIGDWHLPDDLESAVIPEEAPEVYFSYAFCLEKRAQAPDVPPYTDEVSVALKLDRRADWYVIARETYRQAQLMMILGSMSAEVIQGDQQLVGSANSH